MPVQRNGRLATGHQHLAFASQDRLLQPNISLTICRPKQCPASGDRVKERFEGLTTRMDPSGLID